MGVPIDSVLRAANCAAESTFRRFYNRELSAVSVSEAVLTPPPPSCGALKSPLKMEYGLMSVIKNYTTFALNGSSLVSTS
ncbi:hypothetical protein DAPPUDRAFT_245509 [Daphnia pulex]|uniref:Uncharacterized protein n=1 Tax=Daphnia pulex TaxID=6669 RepID=E9GNH6_DAPPU|nr:hypothetical protein DAPPUDRAFT_245509 [Daphnia pulex]|eukprot:EFX78956.1 hypothetical protein DAPPUDRAFT_245509 [Daphnia pulex]